MCIVYVVWIYFRYGLPAFSFADDGGVEDGSKIGRFLCLDEASAEEEGISMDFM